MFAHIALKNMNENTVFIHIGLKMEKIVQPMMCVSVVALLAKRLKSIFFQSGLLCLKKYQKTLILAILANSGTYPNCTFFIFAHCEVVMYI